MAKELIADDAPEGNSGPRATARLIPYAYGKHVALPPHTTLEIIEHPQVIAVPGAAYYALGVLAWHGQWIALIDLNALVRAHVDAGVPELPRYALVVAYQSAAGQPVRHAAVALASLPESIGVGDGDACALPNDSDIWSVIATSCFAHEGQPVPIIDTARLFAGFHG